ncbi:MAG: hypothetical protein KA313_02395 [Pseudarcicella sp.]|nr:hypothetical protein [Pseudarcicella sp.]MBP6409929.1 hypothetical protein [Pseudarcicella sp.]
MNINYSNSDAIPPHLYPKWIKIVFIFILALIAYTIYLIPKALRVRNDVKLSDMFFKRADSLFKAQKFNEAIPLYKKSSYLSWEKKPIKLAICYLKQNNTNSLHTALGILSTAIADTSNFNEIVKALPSKYLPYIKPHHVYMGKIHIHTTYNFDFSELEKEEPTEYKKIKNAENIYLNFIHTNPNN